MEQDLEQREKYPALKFAFSHGGGAFPFTLGRIDHGFNVRPDLCAIDNPILPSDYIGKFYVDSLVHDKEALQFLINLMGYEISRTMQRLTLENVTLTQVMDSMADGVIVLDGDGQVTLFNYPARKIFSIGDLNPLGSRIAESIRDFEIMFLY